MLDKLLFAFEKIAALLASQRTLAAIAGIVITLASLWRIVAPLFGVVTDGLPGDTELESVVAVLVAGATTFIVAIGMMLSLLKSLIDSLEIAPPSLIRSDYENLRKPSAE